MTYLDLQIWRNVRNIKYEKELKFLRSLRTIILQSKFEQEASTSHRAISKLALLKNLSIFLPFEIYFTQANVSNVPNQTHSRPQSHSVSSFHRPRDQTNRELWGTYQSWTK